VISVEYQKLLDDALAERDTFKVVQNANHFVQHYHNNLIVIFFE